MLPYSSKTLLPEPFTGSNDFESYFAHFELLSQLQKWLGKKTVNGTETEIDGRPHCFALRLQKPAVDFFRTLSEDIRKSYDETFKSFWISRLFCFRFLKRNFYSCSNLWLSFNYCGWKIFDLKCNRIFFEFKKSSFSAFEQILQCQIRFPVLNVRIWMQF